MTQSIEPSRRVRSVDFNSAILASLCFGLGVLAVLLTSPARGYAMGQAVIVSLECLFGVFVFLRHGGSQITAAGMYSLASVVFVGYAGIWWLMRDGSSLPAAFFAATAAAYLSHVAMYFLFWHRVGSSDRFVPIKQGTREISTWTTTLGALTLFGSVVLWMFAPELFIAFRAGGFVGILLLTLGLLAYPSTIGRFGLARIGLIGLAIVAYVLTIFTGYGRLTIVTIIVACAIATCTRFRGRLVKIAAIVGAPAVGVALNQFRYIVVADKYGAETAGQKVPGSIVNPLETFARMIDGGSAMPRGDGSTFFATIVFFVPRAIWPEKPIGFGAELTTFLEPQLVALGHSMAALSQGEWFFNFGWLGVVLMVPAIGLTVRWFDILLATALHRNLSSRRNMLGLAVVITLIAGLNDLVWNGTFTYLSRAGFQVAVLGIFLVIFASKPRRGRQRV